jgi:2-phospho-L-lactate transferase/gluconeogenesis factor (CofD/UPF0052 family)
MKSLKIERVEEIIIKPTVDGKGKPALPELSTIVYTKKVTDEDGESETVKGRVDWSTEEVLKAFGAKPKIVMIDSDTLEKEKGEKEQIKAEKELADQKLREKLSSAREVVRSGREKIAQLKADKKAKK